MGCARSEVQIEDRSVVSLVITIKNCPHLLVSENALRCVLWWTCVALYYGTSGAITVGATRYPTTHPFVKRSICFVAHDRPLASKAKAPIGGVTLKFLDLLLFIDGCFCPSALGVCARRESKKFQNLKLLMQLEGLKPRASEKLTVSIKSKVTIRASLAGSALLLQHLVAHLAPQKTRHHNDNHHHHPFASPSR